MVSVVRYALGRSTYIVGWTVGETLRVWPRLSENTRGVIRRDVERALADGQAGMKMDVLSWESLLERTAPEKARRGE